MKTHITRLVGLALLVFAAGSVGCGVIGASVLDQYWIDQIGEDINGLDARIQAAADKPDVPGTAGKDGVDGKDGNDGKDGIDGKDGNDGNDGVDAKDGKDGVDGKGGEDGKDGPAGPAGPEGPKGDPGVLTRAQIDAAGEVKKQPSQVYKVVHEGDGRYKLYVQLPDKFDTNTVKSADDFPIIVTPHPVIFPGQGGQADMLVVGIEPLAFDRDQKTLEVRVHLRRVPSGDYRDSDFTFVLMQP